MSINKAKLVVKIAEKTRLTQVEAARALNAAIEIITQACAEGDTVQIKGFGAFERRVRPARRGRNPKTKQPMLIPESKAPVFKPGKLLREAVTGER